MIYLNITECCETQREAPEALDTCPNRGERGSEKCFNKPAGDSEEYKIGEALIE